MWIFYFKKGPPVRKEPLYRRHDVIPITIVPKNRYNDPEIGDQKEPSRRGYPAACLERLMAYKYIVVEKRWLVIGYFLKMELFFCESDSHR